jgi:group I intron endonuclease
MQINHKEHKNKAGIYLIRNKINNKVYIGKSINISSRMSSHKYGLRSKNLNLENNHFINAWHKYGEENFEYIVLEFLEKPNIECKISVKNFENLIKNREFFWISTYDSINREKGYNLKMDSSQLTIISEETLLKFKSKTGIKNPNYGNKWSEEKKKYMSNLKKEQYLTGDVKINLENCRNGVKALLKKYKDFPETKKEMAEKVSIHHTKYNIHQYSKDGQNLIKIWDRLIDIIVENPNYKKHNIYAVCSGEKPSMYGFKWFKIPINDDIVQPL